MHKHHSAGVTHLWNIFLQKPFSHGNNNIWFEARLVANINLHISLFSTTNDKPHKIDSFVLNHNAYLNFIIISLLLPSHSYALTSFFDFRLLQHLRHDTKDNFKSLTFIIISLFLPSHSYALTSFFLVFFIVFRLPQHLRHDTKDNSHAVPCMFKLIFNIFEHPR